MDSWSLCREGRRSAGQSRARGGERQGLSTLVDAWSLVGLCADGWSVVGRKIGLGLALVGRCSMGWSMCRQGETKRGFL